jgi:ATP synthase protein I
MVPRECRIRVIATSITGIRTVGGALMDDGEDGLDRRLNDLGERLEKRKAATSRAGDEAGGAAKGAYSQAIKVSSEFVAGIVAGALIGYLVDWLAGTSPWGMIIFLMLGFGAAVLNVMRALGVVATPMPQKRGDDKK